jgi:hypothetical protein
MTRESLILIASVKRAHWSRDVSAQAATSSSLLTEAVRSVARDCAMITVVKTAVTAFVGPNARRDECGGSLTNLAKCGPISSRRLDRDDDFDCGCFARLDRRE